ncbi:MAG: immune inhibitor A, partial [Prevotellaceae bacterium]|nr:immune inhibitor A [Prevotellaceae bacterium]
MKQTILFNTRILLLLLFLLGGVQAGHAVVADPTPHPVKQPDGTFLTVRLHGDEFYHFNTTIDGYTILKSPNGGFVYARQEGERVVAGTLLAHDAAQRTAAEKAVLETTPKYLAPSTAGSGVTRAAAERMNSTPLKAGISSTEFRGIIILAQFSDNPFTGADCANEYTAMVNESGYANNGATGSVHDYFYATSMGVFAPHFDVVGPVTIDYKQTDAKGSENGQALVRDACIKADELVNFADYDLNGDGEVDMIYVLFAGVGSNVSGNNPDYVWPHAYALNNAAVQLDGVYCNRYACSTELTGAQALPRMDGIGTICHEFSHV